jgi:hypothetical protein
MDVSAVSQNISDIVNNSLYRNPNDKNNIENQQTTSKIDEYSGSIPQDITYQNSIKNNLKEQVQNSTKNGISKKATEQTQNTSEKQQINQNLVANTNKDTNQNISTGNKKEINVSKPVNPLKTVDQIAKDSKTVTIKGNPAGQVVLDIIVQTQKTVADLNKLNLSKNNRMTKKIEITA